MAAKPNPTPATPRAASPARAPARAVLPAAVALIAAALIAAAGCARKHAAAPVEPRFGTLVVGSNPPGAAIRIDGTDMAAVTPDDFTLTEGSHRAEVVLAGHTFTPASTTLAVPAEGTVTYTFVEFAPRLSPSETAHGFGPQALGTASAPWCVTVTNAGNAPADSGTFALGGTDAGAFAITSGAHHPAMPPGATQQVCVAFRPAREGAATAVLAVGGAGVSLSGTGYREPCRLEPSSTAHDFGSQVAGQAYPDWCLDVRNTGTSACADTLRLGGPDADQFAIVSGAAYDLAPGASQAVCVAFRPTVAGAVAASLATGTTPVALAGVGVGSCDLAPAAGGLAPDGTAFGDVCLGSAASRRLELANGGNLACTVTASACGAFTVSPASARIEPGTTSTFQVAFRPGVVAAESCAVTLAGGGQSWSATFTGRGVDAPVAEFDTTGTNGPLRTGSPIRFTPRVVDGGSPVTAYRWDFGDGTTATSASPQHTYRNGGTYTVTLTVTNACGSSPMAAHTYCVEEPAYVYLWHFDSSTVPDYTTNVPGWGTTTPLVLYRGPMAGYDATPVIICANVAAGEILRCGRNASGVASGGSETIGVPGQSFALAHLPVPPQETGVTIEVTEGAPSVKAGSVGPVLYVKSGSCGHLQLGNVSGNELACDTRRTTTHCAQAGLDGRIVWGLEPQILAGWMYVDAVRITFSGWYVCPGGAPATRPLQVVDAAP